jgi:hypothetical protein
MPAGSTAIGYAAFGAVKLVGYSASAFWFRRRNRRPDLSPLTFGLARTALGIAAGASVGLVVGWLQVSSIALFLGALLPVRIFEWLWVFRWFFRTPITLVGPRAIDAIAGTVWSYALDAVGIFLAFVVPGGFWIC